MRDSWGCPPTLQLWSRYPAFFPGRAPAPCQILRGRWEPHERHCQRLHGSSDVEPLLGRNLDSNVSANGRALPVVEHGGVSAGVVRSNPIQPKGGTGRALNDAAVMEPCVIDRQGPGGSNHEREVRAGLRCLDRLRLQREPRHGGSPYPEDNWGGGDRDPVNLARGAVSAQIVDRRYEAQRFTGRQVGRRPPEDAVGRAVRRPHEFKLVGPRSAPKGERDLGKPVASLNCCKEFLPLGNDLGADLLGGEGEGGARAGLAMRVVGPVEPGSSAPSA